ncbi:MAG: Lateral flagellin [Aquabacterium sp.]|uniref:flagellin N-terminal helical domain-containing protein n=2 Tax=Aquabacterium sp. TaxID=1872578 RepID=UPI0025C3747E|nr:flagellin [Aquabacterium sp.]MBI3382552.1 Lateral flagellin [Aquabacterium sp.]
MLSLQTNVASLSTQNSLGATQKALSTSMARLGSGFRVNSAMDDAAGLQIATRMNAQSRGMAVAQRNTQNGISMLQTGEGAFSEVTDILTRMKDLATEAANGTSTANDQTAMQSEFDALGQELGNIMNNTSFGGAKLLKGGTLAGAITFQIGASSAETMTANMAADMTQLDTDLGAATANYTYANRLDHVYNNLANIRTNTDAAKGRIMDVDYASETANMTSKQMLMQASTSMLKQSNSMSQMVMSLMQ